MITVRCKNNNVTMNIPEGSSLQEILPQFNLSLEYPAVSAKVDNVSRGLNYRVYKNHDIEYIDVREASGMRAYMRSLFFVLYKAAQDVFPESKLYILHSISQGIYCDFIKKVEKGMSKSEMTSRKGISPDEVVMLRNRMQEIISEDIVFQHFEVTTEEAVKMFRERGMDDKVRLLETGDSIYTDYYKLGDTVDYYYGPLVPSTGCLKLFALDSYGEKGMVLRMPSAANPSVLDELIPQPKTFEVFKEYVAWNGIMEMANAGEVNEACRKGMATEMMQVAEALQEKKIVKIAEEIERRYYDKGIKLVLITGPSSSGKTTFCKRLSVQLMACGLHPVSFSTDDYFVNRVDTPLLPDGRYDFDNFESFDHKLLSDHLYRLMNGEEVEIPEYNFKTGMREYNGKFMKMGEKSILIIEGIHALNPRLTEKLGDDQKFRIFISALTSVALDDHNLIPMRDNRLLRRIIRDYNRMFTAQDTIAQWPLVCEGEDKWIYPFQESADMMFNSALSIEFALLRNYVEPILRSVPRNCPEYAEAHRLLKFIHYFVAISDKDIPLTSIMREFVGGSSFRY